MVNATIGYPGLMRKAIFPGGLARLLDELSYVRSGYSAQAYLSTAPLTMNDVLLLLLLLLLNSIQTPDGLSRQRVSNKSRGKTATTATAAPQVSILSVLSGRTECANQSIWQAVTACFAVSFCGGDMLDKGVG